jgi:hypothetical protein
VIASSLSLWIVYNARRVVRGCDCLAVRLAISLAGSVTVVVVIVLALFV